jgi:1,2-phenylacetyl-CoA epoxidase catalytic subunit
MEIKNFIEKLGKENEVFFSKQGKWATTYWAEEMNLEVAIQALKVRYWNEYIGFEVIGRFMYRVPDPEFRVLVGRQVGDEAKHAYYMEKRIKELGGSVAEPMPEQLEFWNTIDKLIYPEEFFAAQQFTVETQSIKRNEQALKNLDPVTADVFRNHINNDEVFHVKLGHMGLAHYCTTEEAQQRATNAARIAREKHVGMAVANAKIIEKLTGISLLN